MSYYLDNIYCNCLNVKAPTCADSYQFSVVEEDTNGSFVITNKNGKKWYIDALTDVNGDVVLDSTDIPIGLFTPYSIIKLEFEVSGVPVHFVSGVNLFPCLFISFFERNIDASTLSNDVVVEQEPFVCCCADKSIDCTDLS